MKASQIAQAISAMDEARSFLQLNMPPGNVAGAIRLEHKLFMASIELKAELSVITVGVADK